MSKGGIFSDREFSEVSQSYREAKLIRRGQVWFYVSLAVAIAAVTVLSIIWVIGAAFTPKPELLMDKLANSHAPPPPVHHSGKTFDYEIDNLNVTFGTRSNSRLAYAQFSLVIQCPTEDCLQWMKMSRASLRDVVFTQALLVNVEDFRDNRGVDNFKNKILAELKMRFREHAPSEVFLRDWFFR